MDEDGKRMEEGLNAKDDDVLKKEETSNINEDVNIDHPGTDTMVKQKTKRIATLDAFRGLTIVVS